MAQGTADSTLESFSEVVDDLCDSLSDNVADKKMLVAKIMCSVKSTMSDLGPVNPLFNKRLEKLREEFLPSVVENYGCSNVAKFNDIHYMFNDKHYMFNDIHITCSTT